jgi:hypothetical protein
MAIYPNIAIKLTGLYWSNGKWIQKQILRKHLMTEKLKHVSQLPQWFKLENYAFSNNLSALEWHEGWVHYGDDPLGPLRC